jgi:hypothetical protein
MGVGVYVGDGVGIKVGVLVAVGVGVAVFVAVDVAVGVGVCVAVGKGVSVATGVSVDTSASEVRVGTPATGVAGNLDVQAANDRMTSNGTSLLARKRRFILALL